MTCSSGECCRLLLAVLATAGLAAGCTRELPPSLVPVKGVVTLDGKPLSSGVVQFQPATGQPATGEIAGDGSFTLSRNAPEDGVPPGTYRVAVVSYDPTAETQSVENLRVPLKYTRFGSSGIEFTVFPGTKGPLAIELVSDGADQGAGSPAGDGQGDSDAASEEPARSGE